MVAAYGPSGHILSQLPTLGAGQVINNGGWRLAFSNDTVATLEAASVDFGQCEGGPIPEEWSNGLPMSTINQTFNYSEPNPCAHQ
jgi:hypothetical protein